MPICLYIVYYGVLQAYLLVMIYHGVLQQEALVVTYLYVCFYLQEIGVLKPCSHAGGTIRNKIFQQYLPFILFFFIFLGSLPINYGLKDMEGLIDLMILQYYILFFYYILL